MVQGKDPLRVLFEDAMNSHTNDGSFDAQAFSFLVLFFFTSRKKVGCHTVGKSENTRRGVRWLAPQTIMSFFLVRLACVVRNTSVA